MILAKFLKNIVQLSKGLQFDICYVINTREDFEIAETTRILNYFSSICSLKYLSENFRKFLGVRK